MNTGWRSVSLSIGPGSTSLPAVLETFDRKTAGAYVTALRARSLSRATTGKRLSALSSMWAWLGSKGHVEANVWRRPRERCRNPQRTSEGA